MSCDGAESLSVRSSPGLSSLVLGSHDEPPQRDPSRHDLAGVTSKRCPVFSCSSGLPSDLMLPPHRRPSGASPSFESDCRPRDGPQQRNSRPFRRMLAFLVRLTSVCALDHSTGRSTTLTCFSVFSSINPRLKIMHSSAGAVDEASQPSSTLPLDQTRPARLSYLGPRLHSQMTDTPSSLLTLSVVGGRELI
jgi:hypothetical protein